MRRAALDPRELLEQLRADHQVLRWGPLPPQEFRDEGGDRLARDKPPLEYLHQHWALDDTYRPGVQAMGPRARLEALFGRLTYKVLATRLREEREFLAQAVQVIDNLDQRCTELALRYQELADQMLDRQVAEAENQAKLAVWLHVTQPTGDSAEHANPHSDEGDASSVP